MPATSEKMRRAMYAAAEGHSKLGIPQSVGEEFVRSDQLRGGIKPELGELTDREAAEAIRDNELPSPTKYGDYWLFDVRVTGTGAAFRDALGEYAIRDPQTWLTPEFIDRCNGLPVIDGHTDAPGLNSEEYRERSIGNVVLPYRKGDEVWAIAKIFDADAALLMQTTKTSTSPGVQPPKDSKPIVLESGAQVLDEGLPLNLDHLAICEQGVWDKDGPPAGVRLDESVVRKDTVMADEDREKTLEKERDDAKMRADASEKERDDAKARADAAEQELKDMRAKHDAEEKERMDARKKRHDKAKHDGEFMDCARCDAEEKGETEEEEPKEDKGKKDAAGEDVVDANRGTEEIKDSTIAKMQAQIDELKRNHAPLTLDERDEVSRAHSRYSPLFQMLLDSVVEPLPGEKPIAYRKRCANALRKYTTSFQNYVFHDAQQPIDVEIVEKHIFDEAMAYAKNPPADKVQGQVRYIKDTTTLPGKVISTPTGDQHAVWDQFAPATQRFLKRVNKQLQHSAAH